MGGAPVPEVTEPGFEHLLRELTPQVLGALVRRYGHFDACEDAVQEALLAASQQWPRDGVPAQPRAWLITVASRRLTDELRSEEARRRREDRQALEVPLVAPGADSAGPRDADDTLLLLFLCCHPSLNRAAQIALTLRAVGGLTTDEIARALLVPEETMRKRITRAKQSIRTSGIPFRPPPPAELPERLAAVLQVLYLIFNEGYTSTDRVDLAEEAIRLARLAYRLLPDNGEVAGLLALMLLTHARRAARTTPAGDLIRLDEQDRSLWDKTAIAEGTALVTDAMTRTALGPYQLQAAIAAVHDEAQTPEATDWKQIVALYDLLVRFDDTPIARLNRAVAIAMVQGPQAGLTLIEDLAKDPRLTNHHRVDVARAHLHELAGNHAEALTAYLAAARRTTSLPEQRYLNTRAARLR
ncbi:RNA polymerase sigma factor [Kribbella sp. CA-294648]|uniref:RNA polymerase sigma factor n=1 Tax=Kribbella sp. CA-294648 TaxID=3239948 RepID=UPI003D93F1A7